MGRKRVTPQDRELIGKEFTSSLVRSGLPDVVWVVRGVYVPSNGMYDNQKLVTCYTRGGKGDAPWRRAAPRPSSVSGSDVHHAP